MIQNVIIPIFTILIIQLVINLALGFIINEKYIKVYRIISYIVFIGLAFTLTIVQMMRLFLLFGNNEAPDAVAISSSLGIIFFWLFNIIAVTSLQLVFNIVFLKRIVTRKQAKHTLPG